VASFRSLHTAEAMRPAARVLVGSEEVASVECDPCSAPRIGEEVVYGAIEASGRVWPSGSKNMPIRLSQDERQHLEKFASRRTRPTSRQKALALLGLVDGQAQESVAQRVGITKGDLSALVDLYSRQGLEGIGLGSSRGKGPRQARSRWDGKIEKTPGVCGGAARIAGTRIPVWQLVEARNLGVSEAQLLIDYPRLRAANLVDAWAYAEAHPAEIDAAIRANEVA
jgi:uncharacterized protein (DUF433 family)